MTASDDVVVVVTGTAEVTGGVEVIGGGVVELVSGVVTGSVVVVVGVLVGRVTGGERTSLPVLWALTGSKERGV